MTGQTHRLVSRRLELRGLTSADWEQWSRVRERSRDWLERWEPLRAPGTLDPARDRSAFTSRCAARERERQLGTGYAFGMFLRDGRFLGEININNVLRSAFMSAHVGYWVDESHAGQGYVPEGLVSVFSFAFDHAKLHRLQISIIPRNRSSRRVVEKLGIRDEGTALRYLLINGVWEDHIRYAITAEEWTDRGSELMRRYVD
ncbi:MAG: GNAT family protein [Actinomycetota bacterium]